MDVDFQ